MRGRAAAAAAAVAATLLAGCADNAAWSPTAAPSTGSLTGPATASAAANACPGHAATPTDWWATTAPATCTGAEATQSAAPAHPAVATPTAGWTGTPAEKRFAWAEDGLMSSGATVTLLRGLTPRRALELVAAHRTTPIESARQARADGGYDVVEAGRVHGWTVVIEVDGSAATHHSVLTRLSVAGPAVVVFQNAEALASFSYAVEGRILRTFDPLIFGTPWIGRPLPQERGIGFGAEADMHPMAQSFLLAYRLTGVALTERDITTTTGRLGVGVTP